MSQDEQPGTGIGSAAMADPVDSQQEAARLTRLLAVVVVSLLAAITLLLTVNIAFQYRNYERAIEIALSGSGANHSGALSYARAWDFAVVKTSSIFLGFLLIFTGALYVLRTAEQAFAFEVTSKNSGGRLNTSSPGLVMIALGVVLVALVLYKDSVVSYRDPGYVSESVVKPSTPSDSDPKEGAKE